MSNETTDIILKRSTIAFMKLEGKQAGPYADVAGGISELHQYAERTHFQYMVANDTLGDTTFGTAKREYFVGVHSGRTTFLVVLACNLGLEEDGKTHRGYMLLNRRMFGHMDDALRSAADFVAEAKSGIHEIFK